MEDIYINKKVNYSLELLRLILSFWVVIQHCYKYSYKLNKGKFHVPIFMIMSFYFYYNTLKTKSNIKIKQRFQRILIPYIIWPILLFVCNNILFKLFKFSQFNKKLLLKDLLHQLIFGSKYHPNFYFLFNLIFFTLLFTIMSFFFKKSFIFIFQILLIISYIFQYSYWNLYFFSKYSNFILYSLGHILEFLPFAVVGITLRYLGIITKLKTVKGFAIFFSIAILFLILKFDIFTRITGFFYPGFLLNIGSICTFIIFSLFSFKNKKIIFLLKIITKFTGGIYYIHMIIVSFLIRKILFIKNKTFKGSIFIYIICYIICYLGNKLSNKTKFKFLFN